jgi:hypothetical protein
LERPGYSPRLLEGFQGKEKTARLAGKGTKGSLAAVPMEPGWSLPLIYYHTAVEAGASKSFEIGGTIAAKLEADADLFLR